MIKGKPSYPFETIALAVAFSPRLEALVAETKRLASLCSAKAIFIHPGKRTSEKERLLNSILLNYGFNDSNCIVHWQDGTPVDVILEVCKANVVDLLIIGVMEEENLLKYYMGSVSREISKRAKCSLLLLVDPKINPEPHWNIVVNGYDHAKTSHSINTAVYLATLQGAKEIDIVDETDIASLAVSDIDEEENSIAKNDFLREEKSKLFPFIQSLNRKDLDIKLKAVSGKTGNTIRQFAQSNKADLLVVNSPDHHLAIFDRIFSHDLEYMLADLPCDMLIVHSRVFDSL